MLNVYNKKLREVGWWWYMSLIPGKGRWISEFKVSLVYSVSSLVFVSILCRGLNISKLDEETFKRMELVYLP